ncbi:MAG: GTPase HflX [Dehalococcoidia bacterium]|nr:MAG: GTPase HflX [Dehalococcoidia bacterium]
MTKQIINTRVKKERAVLVGVDERRLQGGWKIESSLEELNQLARTAGAEVVGKFVQKMEKASSTHYLGSGKLQELIDLKEELKYDTAIFNDELAPRQQRNLEEALGVKVIDRTALIIDIFARSASTSEGKLQVELAQHQYLLPRLEGQWSHLERLGGGIGTRGPGESQIETDRRLIRSKIASIKKEIEAVRRHRELYRRKRKKSNTPLVALVGYTNAGKSTLLNAISKSNVLTENKLFSTLDPVTRRLRLPDGRNILLTDTVGFIHKLPTLIVAAFHATLEELEEADLLLHVVDITSPEAVSQSNTVEQILKELDLSEKPQINVINKIDRVVENLEDAGEISLLIETPPETTVVVSAVKNWNLDKLLEKISAFLKETCGDDKEFWAH